MNKLLRYQKYLDKYKKCPPDSSIERDFICYRWVHEKYTENDFLPQLFMSPPRVFENNEITCNHYCLSVFKDLSSAIKKYKHICENAKESFAVKFKSNVGEHTAELTLLKQDGVSDAPNIEGHISFHPYNDCELLKKVTGLFNNFA
jgi:hypothetical protein